jgi:hypothetical protein
VNLRNGTNLVSVFRFPFPRFASGSKARRNSLISVSFVLFKSERNIKYSSGTGREQRVTNRCATLSSI